MNKIILYSFLFTFFSCFNLYALEKDEFCFNQIQSLCGPEAKRERDCLSKVREQLPIECKVKIQNIESTSKSFIKSKCLDDIKKHCPMNIEAFQKEGLSYMNKYTECVKKAEKKFSTECKKRFHKIRMGSFTD